jgi:chromosome segregation ATPase
MDKETAKEIEDLQNNLKALVHRKRKREEATLEHENKKLKTEIQQLKNDNKHLKENQNHSRNELRTLRQSLTSSAKECSLANLELTEVKQSKGDLETDNKRLKNELEQQVLSKVFLQQSHDATQTETIKTHTEKARLLHVKIQGLQSTLKELKKYKAASQKAVSELKEKRRLEMEAEFKLLVSCYIKGLNVVSGYELPNNVTGWNLRHRFARSLGIDEQ